MSASPASWFECAKGQLIAVDAERVLYEAPNSGEFWVHMRVRNLTRNSVGIQLKSGWQAFYPNQWQGATTPHRQEINERRMNVGPLGKADQAELLDAWKMKSLVIIPADGNADYFRVFNGSGVSRKEFERQAAPFMIVALDVQLRATDGVRVELVQPGEESRELSLPAPVQWAPMSAGGSRVDVK